MNEIEKLVLETLRYAPRSIWDIRRALVEMDVDRPLSVAAKAISALRNCGYVENSHEPREVLSLTITQLGMEALNQEANKMERHENFAG